MKLPENGAATVVKVAIAFAIFATGYYFPLFRPASTQQSTGPTAAASGAAAPASPTAR